MKKPIICKTTKDTKNAEIPQKNWVLRNPEKVKLYQERWRNKNREQERERGKKWYKENSVHCKKYRQENKEKIGLRNLKYQKQRLKIDPKYHLDKNMGSVLSYCLRGIKAGRRWENLVNYTIEDLMKYLEEQFDDKMTWENYGSYWHIDHRKPKSWFKYKTAEDPEFKKCWALKNLQPMEKNKNLSKNNRYEN